VQTNSPQDLDRYNSEIKWSKQPTNKKML
jgi:hypothetical protein